MRTARLRPVRHGFAAVLAGAALSAALAGCHDREVARGAALYKAQCARCHGEEGAGQNPARPWGSLDPVKEGFIAPALDGRGHCSDHPRNELLAIIAGGSKTPGSPMAGFQDKLSASEQAAIVAYLETLWDRAIRRWYELRERELAKQGR